MLLYQPTKGYSYNSDSIFLYNFIREFKPKGTLLDVGCGVGVISSLLTRDFKIDTYIIDKQKKMLEYAKINFNINRLNIKNIYEEDFLNLKIDTKFDFIVSNPPFYKSSNVTQSSIKEINIARYSHHLPLEEFIRKSKELLKARGNLIFCYDAKQIDNILYFLIKYKINPEVLRFVHSKIDRSSKLVMIKARLNSKSMLDIKPPLVVFDKNSQYTKEAKEAFLNASTHTIKGDIEFLC
jgi:tRNA1(Val) A37 N6-methylase TrmN6